MAIPAALIDENEPKPASVQFMGTAYSEDLLLRVAYSVGQELGVRPIPSWAKEFGE